MGFASPHQDSNDALDNDVANGHERPSQPAASIELEAEFQIEKSSLEYSTDSDDYTPRRKPKKYRSLSDIYKELGSSIGWTEGSKFPTDTQNNSDNRGKKHARSTSKNSGSLKNKRKTARLVEPRFDQVKRSKPVSDNSLGNNSHLGSIYNLRKNRAVKRDLQPTNKAAANDRPRRNLARLKPQKHRLLSDIYQELGSCVKREFATDTQHYSDDITLGAFIKEKKRARATSKNKSALKNKTKTPDQAVESRFDRAKRSLKPCVAQKAKGVSNLCNGNQKHFTEHGARSAQLVHPTTAISNKNMETVSGSVQKRIAENSPLSDYESMAAFQLLSLSNAGVNRKTYSKMTTEDRASSVMEPKSLTVLNGAAQLSSRPVGCKLPVEVNVTNCAILPQTEQTEFETYICRISKNPAEFSTRNAKKFMRRVKSRRLFNSRS